MEMCVCVCVCVLFKTVELGEVVIQLVPSRAKMVAECFQTGANTVHDV